MVKSIFKIFIALLFPLESALAFEYKATTEGTYGSTRVCILVDQVKKCSIPIESISVALRRQMLGLSQDINKGYYALKTLKMLNDGFDPRVLTNFHRDEACQNIDRIKKEIERDLSVLENSAKQYTCARLQAVPRKAKNQ